MVPTASPHSYDPVGVTSLSPSWGVTSVVVPQLGQGPFNGANPLKPHVQRRNTTTRFEVI